jgi:exopolysaccharide production protein ExoQ
MKVNLEKAFVIFVLLFSARVGVILIYGDFSMDTDPEDTSSLTIYIWSLVYLISGVLFLKKWKNNFNLITKDKLLIALVALTIVSVIWSNSPIITLRRSIALLGTTIFAVYLAANYSRQEWINLLSITFAIIVSLSLIVIIFFPEIGIHQFGDHTGRIRGVLPHKNTFGHVLILCQLIFYVKIRQTNDKQFRVLWLSLFVLSLIFLVLTDSVTSVALFMLLVSLFIFVEFLKKINLRSKLLVYFVSPVMLSVIIALLILNFSVIFNLLGREADLTGRVPLWLLVFNSIMESPILGYGYAAFWLGMDGPSRIIWEAIPFWEINHSHNGILDLWLSIGIFGVILFLIHFTRGIYLSINNIKNSSSFIIYWPLLFLVFFIILNFASSHILRRNHLFWILYVATLLDLLKSNYTRLIPIKYSKDELK